MPVPGSRRLGPGETSMSELKEQQSPSAARVTHTGGTELNTINTYIAMSVQTERKHTDGRKIEIQIAELLDSDCPDAINPGAVDPDDQTAQAMEESCKCENQVQPTRPAQSGRAETSYLLFWPKAYILRRPGYFYVGPTQSDRVIFPGRHAHVGPFFS